MKLRYTDDAAQQAEDIDAYWVENRTKNPALFANELLAAEEHLLRAPEGAPVHRIIKEKLVRRLTLKKTRHTLYYWINESEEILWIICIWGAVKGKEPNLSP